MKTRTFGRLGWPVTEIGFGGWAIGGSWGPQAEEESLAALRKALDLGVNFIDTAAGYGNGHSERLIGKVLKERGLKGGGNGKVLVATKIPPKYPGEWPPIGVERCDERYPEAYLREQLEERLRNLNAEAVDLIQLHTWTRAWNENPVALTTLQKFKKEGKLLGIGISTPEQDQNALNQLVRGGLLDSVQVIYNIFEQDPAEELFPLALKHKVGIIVRVAYDEGSLTGKFTKDTKFAEGDFRRNYFSGDRLERTVAKVEKVRDTVAKVSGGAEKDLAAVAARFVLKHPAVSTVITGIRSVKQAELNCSYGDLPPLADDLYAALHAHYWRRMMWHSGFP
jgi:aryl-alcohol dehydrogenase-like predicted oxidoreductase